MFATPRFDKVVAAVQKTGDSIVDHKVAILPNKIAAIRYDGSGNKLIFNR